VGITGSGFAGCREDHPRENTHQKPDSEVIKARDLRRDEEIADAKRSLLGIG
jgi:hypothetical protein